MFRAHRLARWLAVLALVLAGVTAEDSARAQAARVPVILLSIDGLKPDYVLEADQHRLKVPHLRRLVADGSYATGVTGVTPTVTYPSHTTLVTGVSPARHGILNNSPFDPLSTNAEWLVLVRRRHPGADPVGCGQRRLAWSRRTSIGR